MNSGSLAFLAAGLLWAGMAKAQESVNATGSDATGTGGSVAFSIGQVVYTTDAGSSGSVAQGVQHPYELYIVGLQEAAPGISLTAYPNPVGDELTLQVDEYANERLSYQLYDMEGRLLDRGNIVARKTPIRTTGLTEAAYLVHVIDQQGRKVQSFRIIKHH